MNLDINFYPWCLVLEAQTPLPYKLKKNFGSLHVGEDDEIVGDNSTKRATDLDNKFNL